jgi:PiT family inorganic phosphate transporter
MLLVLIASFAAVSGINDGGNLAGTFLPARAVSPRVLLPLLIISVGLGPLLFGTAVSHTIAVEIVNLSAASPALADAALAGALGTLLVTWWLKVPSSTTIALAGGMVGAALLTGHGPLVHWGGVAKVALGLVGSVAVGFLVAWGASRGVWRAARRVSAPGARRRVGYAEAAVLLVQGLAYGANDQEKAIGLLALDLSRLHGVPYHVSAVAVALPLVFWTLGLLGGGWRIARTVGGHIFRIRPLHALSVQTAAAATVVAAAVLGLPVSTTQTTDGALFGVGASLAPRRVQWQTGRRLVLVWATTLPLAMVLGGTFARLAQWIH